MADKDRALSLDRATCLELLRSVDVGRVAWARHDGRVLILPVNFVVDDEAVIIKTAAGSKVTAVEEGRPLSFEADDLEPGTASGMERPCLRHRQRRRGPGRSSTPPGTAPGALGAYAEADLRPSTDA